MNAREAQALFDMNDNTKFMVKVILGVLLAIFVAFLITFGIILHAYGKEVKMIIEIVKYGDFDMPYTDSVWESQDELKVSDLEMLATRFWGGHYNRVKSVDLHGRKSGITISAASGQEPDKVADEFRDYLKKHGWKKIETVSVTFSD